MSQLYHYIRHKVIAKTECDDPDRENYRNQILRQAEITDCIGKKRPGERTKSQSIKRAGNGLGEPTDPAHKKRG